MKGYFLSECEGRYLKTSMVLYHPGVVIKQFHKDDLKMKQHYCFLSLSRLTVTG